MSYTFGKPQPAPPYTGAGEIDKTQGYVSLMTRVKVVARIPADQFKAGGELTPDFEPRLRKALAEALVGVTAADLVVDYVAVEQFEDAGG